MKAPRLETSLPLPSPLRTVNNGRIETHTVHSMGAMQTRGKVKFTAGTTNGWRPARKKRRRQKEHESAERACWNANWSGRLTGLRKRSEWRQIEMVMVERKEVGDGGEERRQGGDSEG